MTCLSVLEYLVKLSQEKKDEVENKYIDPSSLGHNSSDNQFWATKDLALHRKIDYTKFSNIGLFMGDLFSENILGLCKLDIEERIQLYNEAKNSENSTIRDTAISRLMNLYYKIFLSTRKIKSRNSDSV